MERLLKNWRLRILLPVLFIHALAFVGLYVFSYRLAVGEVIRAHEWGAASLLSSVVERFEATMFRRHPVDLGHRLQRLARSHRFDLWLHGADGKLVAETGTDLPESVAKVLDAETARAPGGAAWHVQDEDTFRMFGAQHLRNETACQGCHGTDKPVLGTVYMSLDLTTSMQETRTRLRLTIGILLGVWIVLMGLMIRVRDFVIGRPLARIEDIVRSITRHRRSDSDTSDLENLAGRLNRAIRSLLEEQKRREASVQRQFARAEQMAALGELAAGLTHEIRNPLAGVSSALQLLRSEEADPASDRSRLLDQMLKELERASTTLDGLLRLARPQPPEKSAVDLVALVRDVARLFEPRLRGRNIRLVVDIPGRVPVLMLDRGQMTQLLLNLLTNSAQAVGEGGAISVRLAPFPDGRGVILSVMDDGAGIPADQIEKIWEPFFTTKAEGTGLGLPICRQIAELHGGTISVESTPGEGTAFLILLPTEPSEIISAHGADPDR